MTKEKLLKLIELFGSFWYVSEHRCICTGGSHMLYFREAPASDVDRFDNLVNQCVENPQSVIVQVVDWRLILMDNYNFYHRWLRGELYPTGVDGLLANYSQEDINIIYASER